MASTRRYSETIQLYSERIDPVPSQVLRAAPIVEQAEQLQADLENALETGEPIRDWSVYVQRSLDKSEEAA